MNADETPVRLRKSLDRVPVYKPGKPAKADGDLRVYKVSSNENPYPPLPSVIDAVRESIETMNRYPDMGSVTLTETLAKHLGVSEQEISFATGSSGVLSALLTITCEPGDEVIYPWRSFESYPIVTALAGAEAVAVPLDAQGRQDLVAMAKAVTDNTRLAMVCTPNNPTGTTVTDAELRAFLTAVPDDLLVVIDEAYVEFITADDAPDAMAIYREFPNVVVLRTFSKAYGLAGMRLGYAVARPRITEAIRKACVPFGVTDMAQRAAIASIHAFDELTERVDALVAERERVKKALADAEIDIPDAQSNFVWFPLGARANDFAAKAADAGLIVRAFDGDGVRVTISETEANDRLIEVAKAFYSA